MFDLSSVVPDSKKKIRLSKEKPVTPKGKTETEVGRDKVLKKIDMVIGRIGTDATVKGWYKPFEDDENLTMVSIRAGRYPIIVDRKVQDENGLMLVPNAKVKSFYQAQAKIIETGSMDAEILKTQNQKPAKK